MGNCESEIRLKEKAIDKSLQEVITPNKINLKNFKGFRGAKEDC